MSKRHVNFKLDESGEYINFSSLGNNILADGILAKAAAIRRRWIKNMYYSDGWVVIEMIDLYDDDNYYPKEFKLKYAEFSDRFVMYAKKHKKADNNKIIELEQKIDKLSAHVLNIMIALEHLPKDYNSDFP